MNKKNKTTELHPLEYYLELQYPVTLYKDPEGGYVAEIKDLPGCMTQAETLEEVMTNIEDARRLWIETAYQYGDNIFIPDTDDQYSGRLLLRMPRSLHRKLAEGSEQERVSLNQFLVYLLSKAVTEYRIKK
jgi:predicted RNase H-like HicB family nuclease